MKRNETTPRDEWAESVEKDGLIWHTADGNPYWDESAYYSFTLAQVEELEEATIEVHKLFIEAGEYVLENNLLNSFGIPEYCHEAIRESWEFETPAINYGRFDFGYDGINPPKLFEYNCDTPTSLLEASIVQWNWKEDKFPDHDQFNGIHEALVDRWRGILPTLNVDFIHCAHIWDDYSEDTLNTSYMRDVIHEAGGATVPILMGDIGFDSINHEFVDLEDHEIEVIYKLYPWEWLMNEEIGEHIVKSEASTVWIEPMWKMIWSNKAILPILWELNPGHKNLLGAKLDIKAGSLSAFLESELYKNCVKKPILAREGANIEIMKDGVQIAKTSGDYSKGPCVFQELFAIPDFGGGRFPVIGSWCVNGDAVGMGIREDGLITGNSARFIPHIIEG